MTEDAFANLLLKIVKINKVKYLRAYLVSGNYQGIFSLRMRDTAECQTAAVADDLN